MLTDNVVCDCSLEIRYESPFNCVWANSASSFTTWFILLSPSPAPLTNSILQMGQKRVIYSVVGVQECFMLDFALFEEEKIKQLSPKSG